MYQLETGTVISHPIGRHRVVPSLIDFWLMSLVEPKLLGKDEVTGREAVSVEMLLVALERDEMKLVSFL